MHLLHQIENVFLLRCKFFVDTILDMYKFVLKFLEWLILVICILISGFYF